MKYKEYVKQVGEQEKCKDRIPSWYNRKGEVNNVAKEVLAVWGDSSSDSDESEQQEDISIMMIEDDV